MDKEWERVYTCMEAVRARTDFVPKVGLILGSGLGGFGEQIRVVEEISYKNIPGLPVSTAPGHVGRFLFGYVGETPVMVMQGRIHMYEGYSSQEVVIPVRLMRLLGAEILFVTNAAGGTDPDWKPGTLMLLADHISVFVPSPLLGRNNDDMGERFPDMTAVYDKGLRDVIRAAARKVDVDMKEGIYCQLTGPQYETPAEIRMITMLGAKAVGMSTVVEAIAARHCGMKVCGVSLISNHAAGISPVPLSGDDVIAAGNEAAPRFTALIKEAVTAMKDI